MKHFFALFLSFVVIGSLLGCSSHQGEGWGSSTTMTSTTAASARTAVTKEDNFGDAENKEIPLTTTISNYEFFGSDETVDSFFAGYNKIAEIKFDASVIERGNIKTKALVYIGDFFFEVINTKDSLSVSMGCGPENEETTLYPVFRDIFLSTRPDALEEEVVSAWKCIHESGYLVEGYEFIDCTITYVPSKKLSYGYSDLRIDVNIPLK